MTNSDVIAQNRERLQRIGCRFEGLCPECRRIAYRGLPCPCGYQGNERKIPGKLCLEACAMCAALKAHQDSKP